MGGRKLLHWPGFSLIFSSFKYTLALHRSQNTHWLCAWMPQGARVFGWRPSASYTTAAVADPNTLFKNTFGGMLVKVLNVKLNGLVMNLDWDFAIFCIFMLPLHWREQTLSDLFE